MNEQELKEHIKNIVNKELKTKYHLNELSSIALETFEEKMTLRLKGKEIKTLQYLRDYIEFQLCLSLAITLKKSPQSVPSKQILNGYLPLFQHVNAILKNTNQEKSLSIFRTSLIELLEKNNYSDANLIRQYKKTI